VSKKNSSEYAKIFSENCITFELLSEINKHVLNELNIKNSGDVTKIVRFSKVKLEEMHQELCPEVIEHCEVTLESQSTSAIVSLNVPLGDDILMVDANGVTISTIGKDEDVYEEEVESTEPAPEKVKISSKRKRKKKYNIKDLDGINVLTTPSINKKRGKKKRLWSEEDMDKALVAVREDGVSLSSAARKSNIPRQTLHDRLHSKYNSTKYGRPTCLSDIEEEILLDFITYKSTVHEPLNITEIRMLATAIAKGNGRPNRFKKKGAGHAWWQCFRKRHASRLKVGKPGRFQHGKSIRTTVADLKQDFDDFTINPNNSTISYLLKQPRSESKKSKLPKKAKTKRTALKVKNDNENHESTTTEPELLKTIQSAQSQVQEWLNELKDKNNEDSEASCYENDLDLDNDEDLDESSSSESESEVSDDSSISEVESTSSGEEETECTDDEKNDTCAICQREKPAGTKKKRILWIFCEQCEYWYHVECEGVSKKDLEKEQYICKRCHYNK